jgi:serine protease Do
MIKQCFCWALTICVTPCVFADTVQLKDNSAIIGKVLTEKRDQVAIDVGYTVLVIPRNQISKVVKNGNSDVESKSSANARGPATEAPTPEFSPVAPAPAPASRASFYTAPNSPPASQSVRDLVKILGEAVVQVRTPGGLGSGFIINEDGFLMTNFHVIEGETQISVEVYQQLHGQ